MRFRSTSVSDAGEDRLRVEGELEVAGERVPLKLDRDQAWADFAGWRVNYDRVLVALAHITMAPNAPWSSDRPMLAARALDLMDPERIRGR